MHAHPWSMGPKMDSLLYAIFGLPPAQPLRLALVDPTDRYLRAWKPVLPCLQLISKRVLSCFFSVLLPLSPSPSDYQRPPFSTVLMIDVAWQVHGWYQENTDTRGMLVPEQC